MWCNNFLTSQLGIFYCSSVSWRHASNNCLLQLLFELFNKNIFYCLCLLKMTCSPLVTAENFKLQHCPMASRVKRIGLVGRCLPRQYCVRRSDQVTEKGDLSACWKMCISETCLLSSSLSLSSFGVGLETWNVMAFPFLPPLLLHHSLGLLLFWTQPCLSCWFLVIFLQTQFPLQHLECLP